MNKLFTRIGLIVLFAIFIVSIMLVQVLFKGWRIDLTESGLYSITEGSQNILNQIDEPINLYVFYSAKASENMPSFRSYAHRVIELLEEYSALSSDKIVLKVIDPVAFSEDEDRAAEWGLQPISKNSSGDDVYFGLVGTNSVDQKQLIPYFHPEKEAFLEYDISKLIFQLNQTSKPKIGVIDGVSALGGFDPVTRQIKQPWFALSQLEEFATLENLSQDFSEISAEVTTLLIIQPKSLSDQSLYAIDQFVLRGGKLIVFTDPLAFVDRQTPSQQNPLPQSAPGQDLNVLFNAWGFKSDPQTIVLDRQLAMYLNIGGRPTKHLAVISANQNQFDSTEMMSFGLESINLHSAGTIELSSENLSIFPILQTSLDSQRVDKNRLSYLTDPNDLLKEFQPENEAHTLAARLEGVFQSAFNGKVPETFKAEHIEQSVSMSKIVVVADVDILADMMWVQVQQVFGQPYAQSFADNGSLFYNMIDVMSGSSDLIGLRGRGRFSRPFDVVGQLRSEAEMKFLDKEKELQQRLEQTESELRQLQASQNEQGHFALSQEQQQAIQSFQNQKLQIRRELRDVRHQLDRDIESLGLRLSLMNMFLVPGFLIIAAFVIFSTRKKLQSAFESQLKG